MQCSAYLHSVLQHLTPKPLRIVSPVCSVLQELALKQLLQHQMLPYLIAGPAAVAVAVDRASRVLAELSTVEGLIQGNCRFWQEYWLSCRRVADRYLSHMLKH